MAAYPSTRPLERQVCWIALFDEAEERVSRRLDRQWGDIMSGYKLTQRMDEGSPVVTADDLKDEIVMLTR